MRAFKTYEEHPPNTPENVKEIVEAKFNLIGGKMPDLLSKFTTLLGNEKEKWGGVAAMKACTNEFFSWKKGDPKQKEKVSTVKDLEEFLFSTNCYVPLVIQGPDRPSSSSNSVNVIQGAVDPPAIPKTVGGPDRSSISKPPTPNVVGPPANPKTLKGLHRPSTSMAVNPNVVNNTSVPPANPKTLKVKIYVGSGWDKDFPNLPSFPSLSVNVKIDGGESHKTKVETKNKTPSWGEEFVFPLSPRKNAELTVEVCDHSSRTKEFAGKICLLVSVRELRQGIRTIRLSNQVGNPCSLARLVVRFMVV